MKRRLVDFAVVVASISLVATGVHFWIADRRAVFRAVYPVQAQIVVRTGSCTPDAPEWMRRQLDQITLHGGSLANQLAFVDADGDLYLCFNGWKDFAFRSPQVDQHTRFRYASLTKIFTADAVLALISEGRLQLDSKLIELLPRLPSPRDPRIADITVEHLLRHQAGFDRLESLDVMFALNQKPWCPHELAKLAAITLDYTPGERYSYSNRGYCLLGAVVEQVTGRPFRGYIRDRFDLDRTGVRFIDGPYLADEVRYDFRNENFFGQEYHGLFDFGALSPVASLSGSAADLAVLIKTMLSRKSLNLLSAPIPKGCGKELHEECFGYAVYPYSEEGSGRVYVHRGLLPGAESLAMIDETGGVLVALTSGTPASTEERKKLVSSIYRARVVGSQENVSLSQ